MPPPTALIVFAISNLLLLGCTSNQSRSKDQRPLYKHAEIKVNRDAEGRPLNLKKRIDDPAEINLLASFFPGAGKGKWTLIAGGWKAWVTVRFVRPDGSAVEVFSDYRDWSEGRGDFRVRGDLAAYVQQLPESQ